MRFRLGWRPRLNQVMPEAFEKRLSRRFQFPLQTFRAITIATSPRFRTVLVPATLPIMRILHSRQLKILLPVIAFLL
jgi:hypothetical protein